MLHSLRSQHRVLLWLAQGRRRTPRRCLRSCCATVLHGGCTFLLPFDRRLVQLVLASLIDRCLVSRFLRLGAALNLLLLVLRSSPPLLGRLVVLGWDRFQHALRFSPNSFHIALKKLVFFRFVLVRPTVMAHVVVLESPLGPVVPGSRK